MIKKPNTNQLIANSIMNLMLTKSIDDISIQDIADNCGITRQTFYNHFKDKYDLVDWIYKTEAVDYISLIGKDCSWYDAVINKLNIIQRNPSFYRKIYRQQWFLDSFYKITKQLYLDVIRKNHTDGINKDLEFMVEFYCYACVKKTSTWVTNGLKESPEELVKSFITCIPDEMKRELLID